MFGAWHRVRTAVMLAVACVAPSCSDSAAPPKPAAIVFVGEADQAGIVDEVVVPAPRFEIPDDAGRALSGISFTVRVASGGGSLLNTPGRTVAGPTSVGSWVLGRSAGVQSIEVVSPDLPSLIITALARPGPPTNATLAAGPATGGAIAGSVSPVQLAIRVTDAFGNAITNLPVSVQITGGGAVQDTNPLTNANGVASVGTWTLGIGAGQQRVTLSPGGQIAPVVFTVTAEPGPAASFTAVTSTTGSGAPGMPAPMSPTVRLTDAFGNGIAGVHVPVEFGPSSGTVANSDPVTDASGVASVGQWTLSVLQGEQSIALRVIGFPPITFTVDVVVASREVSNCRR
jgi:adhesin/invasin